MAPATVIPGGFSEECSMAKVSSDSVTLTTATNKTAMRHATPRFQDEAQPPVVFMNTEEYDMSKRCSQTSRPRNEAPVTLSNSYSEDFGPNETQIIPPHSQNPRPRYGAPTIVPSNYYLQNPTRMYEAPVLPPNNQRSRDILGPPNSNYLH